MDVQVGDWICTLLLGQPCYSKVEYYHGNKIVTTAGTFSIQDVLEVRRKEE